jgi:quercetin dioxygenase-like cupin family protein
LAFLDRLMVAVLDFSDGPWAEPEPPHRHPHEQISYVTSGTILFFCEGEEPEELGPGDLFVVPSGKAHTIQLLSDSARLIDAFSPIREDFIEDRSPD